MEIYMKRLTAKTPKHTLLILLVLACMAPGAATAATSTALLAVSATVLSVCGIAATPMVFGNYSSTSGTPTDATSTITATCTSGVPYTIAMDAGAGTGGTVATRVLASGGNTLNYTVYSNTGRTTIWGDGTNSTSTVGGTGGLVPQIYTAYGRIPTGQLSPAGVYLDTVTVTLTY